MSKSKELKILKHTRELISKGWTQNTYARDKDGEPTPSSRNEDKAVCWCLFGALIKADLKMMNEDDYSPHFFIKYLEEFESKLGEDIPRWNDDPQRTQQDVLNLLDNLISELEG